LEGFGCDLDNSLWSADLLATNPEAIFKAHMAYLYAGAGCITTASYQATIPGFVAAGYDVKTAESLIVLSVQLAERAIEQFMVSGRGRGRPLIAASIGPYGAYLADGSEYRGNYGLSDKELAGFHQPRLELLDRSNADILACETIPDFREARVLGDLLRHTRKPAWISFSCKDEQHLNDGTPIRECAAFFSTHPTIFAIGVNCTAPRFISGLIREVKAHCGSKKIVIYPNSGEAYNSNDKTWTGAAHPADFATMAKEWMHLGADIMGGCCRIGPEQIKSLDRITSEYDRLKS
jgi:homocysteine S-methyltransferase